MGFPKLPQGVIDQARNDRMEREITWDKINLFLRGVQWLRPWSRGDKSWTHLQSEGNSKLFVTVNRMIAYLRAAQARLTLTFPSAGVLPATGSQEDILKATTSQQILRFFWSEANIATVGFNGSRFLINYGSYALHTYYELSDGESAADTDGSGNVRMEAVSPYNFFLEPGADELGEAEFVILRTYVTKRDLKSDHPGKSAAIKNLAPTDKQRGTYRTSSVKREIDRFEKLEWYFKDGSHGVSVGNVWLEQDKKFFDKRFFPIQIVYYTKLDDQPYGMGIMESLAQLQWLYNKSRTRTARNLEKMGHAKLMAPKGSISKASDWNDKAGGIVTYNEAAGKPWVWAPSVNIGQEVDQALRIASEMDDVAGIHSVSRGKQVPGMRSGKAIEALADTDSADMITTVVMVEAAFKLGFQVALHLYQRHYKKKRVLRMWDGFGGAVFKTIDRTKLVEDPDVFIEAGSMFRDSISKRRTDVLERFQMQLIDADEANEALGSTMGSNQHLMEKIQSMRKAFDALEHIKEGLGPIRIFASDDLKSIRKVFTEFMSSPDFEKLSPPQQEYIGNVIATIDTHGQSPEAFERASALQQVLPRQDVPSDGVGPGTGQAVQSAPGLANNVADVESSEQVMARRENASPIGKRL